MPSHSHTRGTMNITGSIAIEPNIITNTANEEDINFGNPSGAFGITKANVVQAMGASTGAPNWYHDKYITFDASRSWSGSTSEEGNNATHNNLQPYLSVFIWKRTA